MDIPSFENFLQTLTEKDISEWVSKANAASLTIHVPITEDNANHFVNSVMSASVLTSIEMLRAYHEWLSEWLKKKSVRLI